MNLHDTVILLVVFCAYLKVLQYTFQSLIGPKDTRPKCFYAAMSKDIFVLRNVSDIKIQQLRHNSFWEQLDLC